tara:strand:+ start:74 stop:1006 length:933 start_codon:yes stop_codon:yes gene_type:complete
LQNKIKIFSGRASNDIAAKIAKSYGCKLGKVVINNFSDGEFQPSYEETLRGKKVFIVQSTLPPADSLLEFLLMIDAAKRASAKEIIAILPYFGFARQDRKDKPRVPIGAKLIANLITSAGASRIMTMDLHADQIQGFFKIPVDHLFASTIFIPYIKSLKLKNLVIASPDIGGSKRANVYAKHLNCEMVICYKQRKKANVIEKIKIIGDISNKDVVIVDDMIDTAGTMAKASDLMKKNGANSIRAICTHPILSGNAYKNLEKSCIEELVVTDSLPISKKNKKIKVLSVAKLFADTIRNINLDMSISSQFIN